MKLLRRLTAEIVRTDAADQRQCIIEPAAAGEFGSDRTQTLGPHGLRLLGTQVGDVGDRGRRKQGSFGVVENRSPFAESAHGGLVVVISVECVENTKRLDDPGRPKHGARGRPGQ